MSFLNHNYSNSSVHEKNYDFKKSYLDEKDTITSQLKKKKNTIDIIYDFKEYYFVYENIL